MLTRLAVVAVGWVRGSWGVGGNLDPLAYESSGPLAGVHFGLQDARFGPQDAHLVQSGGR